MSNRKSAAHKRLEIIRRAYGITKVELARRIGVKPSYLTDVVKERRPVSAQLAMRVEEHLHASAKWILTGIQPALLPDYKHPESVVRVVQALTVLEQDYSFHFDRTSLPVQDEPASGEVIADLHREPSMRRSVAPDRWQQSRYYLRVPESMRRPDEVLAGDFLIVESAIHDWEGSRTCLCILRVRSRVILAMVEMREIRARHVTPATGSRVCGRQVSPDEKFDLLGIVVRVERDLPGLDASQAPGQ